MKSILLKVSPLKLYCLEKKKKKKKNSIHYQDFDNRTFVWLGGRHLWWILYLLEIPHYSIFINFNVNVKYQKD